MCGEFDDHERADEELFERFVEQAARFGVTPATGDQSSPANLDSEDTRGAYLAGLFSAGLTRCVTDAHNLPEGHRMDAVAGQAIAFGRLAGFLAAQLPPDVDLFRAVTGAVLEGHEQATAA